MKKSEIKKAKNLNKELKDEDEDNLLSSSLSNLSNYDLSSIMNSNELLSLTDYKFAPLPKKDDEDNEFLDILNKIKTRDASIVNKKNLSVNGLDSLIPIKNKIQSKSSNSNNSKKISDLNEELTKVLHKNSFSDIINIIIKIKNNISIEKEENKELCQILREIIQNYKCIDDIILLLLKYLNEKFSNKEINNNNDKNNLVIEIKDDNSIDDNTDAESNIKPAKFKYIHILKNYRYCIQSYIIKNVDKDSGIVIYCENKNCKAFCHLTASKVYAKGTHNHKGTSKSFFNSKYPILVNQPSWKFAKIINCNGKDIIKIYN